MPNKIITIRPNDSPWYTNELRCLKCKVTRFFHKYKQSKKESDWAKYKDLRNNYQNELDLAEAKYKTNLSQSLKSQQNSKAWWKTVKWLIGKGGDTSYPTLKVRNKLIVENKEKAEVFNKFFLLHSNIEDKDASLPEDSDEVTDTIEYIHATESEIYDLLKSIDPSKATGPDGVNPRLLKEADVYIVPFLTKLINLSLSTGKVPHCWKLAHVIPLFKKGEADTNNYRPVSLLSCVSKLLERIVFKYVFNHLRSIEFLSCHQSGFQPGDSTVHQLAYLYHMFCDALDRKKDVHIVFCDISKAFDRVWHKGLLYKIRKAGIRGILYHWFANYLDSRYQQVLIRGQKSEIGYIKAGVPQGSVLGPLLFLIYINDLTEIVDCNIKLFADDTSLYIEVDNPNVATQSLNTNLTSICNWAESWLVKFSPSKTKLMTCSFKNVSYTMPRFNNVELDSVKSHKHLGLVLTHDLSWSPHIQSIIKNVSPMIDVLKKLKYNIDRKSLETIYFSFI